MARQISKAAAELGYSGPDWMELSSEEKRFLRNQAQNERRQVGRFVARPPDKRTGDNRPKNWTSAQWAMYKKATAK